MFKHTGNLAFLKSFTYVFRETMFIGTQCLKIRLSYSTVECYPIEIQIRGGVCFMPSLSLSKTIMESRLVNFFPSVSGSLLHAPPTFPSRRLVQKLRKSKVVTSHTRLKMGLDKSHSSHYGSGFSHLVI